MAGDSKAFNEVRALLSKLDRSIDEARSRRVGPKEPAPTRAEVASENRAASRSDLDREIGAPRKPATALTPMQAKRAQYGRARPLNPGATPPAPKPDAPRDAGWKGPTNYDDLTIG